MSGSPFGGSAGPFQSPASVNGPADQPPVKRGRSLLWILVGGTLGLLCMCSGLCLLPVGFGLYQAVGQREAIGQAIDQCLRDVKEGNLEGALERFSSRARKRELATEEQLEELREDPAFVGYASLSPEKVGVTISAYADETKAQGVVATASGSVIYQDGGAGTFEATLEKEDGAWKIHSVNLRRTTAEMPDADN